jgi:hypothetical protein
MKYVIQMGLNNHKKQNEGCGEDMELNPVTYCLPVHVQKNLAEECNGDDDLTVHEEMPSTLDKVFKQIFKKMEERNQE